MIFFSYSTHMVGKWHLGGYKRVYTPTFRGFDSFLGFWNGAQDQTTQKSREFHQVGFDFRRNMEVANDIRGQYTANIITDESVRIIESHANRSDPLFLFISHAVVHNGDSVNRLAVPPEILEKFAHIEDANLRNFTGKST
jgi:arylsulfatase A-like enzyme